MQASFVIFQLQWMNHRTSICSTSQLLVFIRGVDEDMNITQELTSLHSMYGTVTGEDIFNELQKKHLLITTWTGLTSVA